MTAQKSSTKHATKTAHTTHTAAAPAPTPEVVEEALEQLTEAAEAEGTQTTHVEQTAATTGAAKAAKPKTDEQRAAAMRRQAGECRRSAELVGVATDAGKSLILRAEGLETDADAIAPRKGKAHSKSERPVCCGTKKDGTPCTAKAMEHSLFCTDHRPVLNRFSPAQRDAFNRIDMATLVEAIGWGRALKMADAKLAEEAQLEAERSEAEDAAEEARIDAEHANHEG